MVEDVFYAINSAVARMPCCARVLRFIEGELSRSDRGHPAGRSDAFEAAAYGNVMCKRMWRRHPRRDGVQATLLRPASDTVNRNHVF